MPRTKRPVTLADALPLVNRLSDLDKVRLITYILPQIEHALAVSRPGPSRSLLGLTADLGPAPSAEEIDEARREFWSSTPPQVDK